MVVVSKGLCENTVSIMLRDIVFMLIPLLLLD